MSREENCEMGFNNGGTETDPFFGSGWDPIVSLAQAENFGGSGGSAMTDAHHEFSDPPLPHHHQLPHYPCFGNGSFSEMVTSFGLNADDYLAKRAISNENSQEDHQNFEEASPNGKRKRKGLDSHSPFNPNKKGEGDSKNKEKLEENNSRGKKQAREDGSNSGEAPPKENYVHVRAKRGQATNSHSLAERVRRERISERMRLLQELVPGCNKITGKAVMLDEIINYVQSLQQQVEFLSMKLATVNPELNIDIDRILSKDNINSRRVLGSNQGLSSSSSPYINGIRPGITFPTLPNTTPPFHSMPQGVWDSELQHLLQMGFDSNPAMGPNGRSKLEL